MKAIVLAAGKGTRMNSDLAKVLHPVAGRPMLLWVMDAVADAGVEDIAVVVGHQADEVRSILPEGARSAHQVEQLGTGHAAAVGLSALEFCDQDDILVIPGDMPLVSANTLRELLALHGDSAAAVTLLTVELDEPGAYGRVIRDGGSVVGIVEAKDATPEQLEIGEVNTSVYLFAAEHLPPALEQIDQNNAQAEFYLTDAVEILVGKGFRAAAFIADPEEGLGINSVDQIAEVEAVLAERLRA
ncbi:MAG: NTP transferase domain-containing protein [Acidimicrobiia bacterium]|nr:NTP transferase domain-containing protein [Acidimicrobiia bacterium]